MLGPEERLRLLACNAAEFIRTEIAGEPGRSADRVLDRKTRALVQLGALVALDAPQAAYGRSVPAALHEGATADELVCVLITVAPSVGIARLVAAAPKIAAAVGYDIDAALEA